MDQPQIIPTASESVGIAVIKPAYHWTVTYQEARWNSMQVREGFTHTEEGARGAIAEVVEEVDRKNADYRAEKAAKDAEQAA
jgi:hypothetical protein